MNTKEFLDNLVKMNLQIRSEGLKNLKKIVVAKKQATQKSKDIKRVQELEKEIENL